MAELAGGPGLGASGQLQDRKLRTTRESTQQLQKYSHQKRLSEFRRQQSQDADVNIIISDAVVPTERKDRAGWRSSLRASEATK